MQYTVDPDGNEPPELVLIQYDHHASGAPMFRARLLQALQDSMRAYNIATAYYYDDAIWIHAGRGGFTGGQLVLIRQMAQEAEKG